MSVLALFHAPRAWLPKVATARPMVAIREGLLWTLPFLLISTLFLLLSQISRMSDMPAQWSNTLSSIYWMLRDILPWIASISIGYILATLHRLPPLPTAFLCLSYLLPIDSLLAATPRLAQTLSFLVAILTPLFCVPIIARLHGLRWLRLAPRGIASSAVRETLNLILPGAVTGVILLLLVSTTLIPLSMLDPAGLQDWLARMPAIVLGPVLVLVNSIAWFFGIHGNYLLQPILDMLDHLPALHEGHHHYALNRAMLFTFVYTGGSGATLGLILAILLCSSQKALRLLALLSLPTAFININEILLFGIPLILNPWLLAPFILAPMTAMVCTLGVLELGWLTLMPMQLPFSTPILFNAYALSGSNWSGAAFQCFLVALSAACYAPFIRRMEQRQHLGQSVHIKSMDITFTRLQEASQLLTREPVSQAVLHQQNKDAAMRDMRALSHAEFYLEFQPQVSLHNRQCSGCEALLRIRTPDGSILSPARFLQSLHEASQMTEVDLWVARQALQQYRQWRSEGFTLPISINVSGATLLDPTALEHLASILARAEGMISVELTEETLIGDEHALHHAFRRLHDIGARIYIDDFGTGYAALSHLYRYDIDVVKLDRSFILSSDTDKGMQVLSGILNLCHGLQLQVVVEGVETAEQMQALHMASTHDMGIQGWYFSKSLPGDALRQFTQKRHLPEASALG